ncbi:hypothetical protein [Rheinheimera aquimaris]|uniref:hypothetical protein n=1 Tax=Rheinheimera aquimaris TaxID=412437 RepID=UPI000E8B52C8|nr:hypothetical protein [Rheinheimera sp.]|tara:strand:+ start:282 stop:611 length:330 start_codon:yes stop_codon:yes gene_type:complete
MKKLIIAAAVMALSAGVNAQEAEGGAGTIGGVATTTIAAGVVGVAVAAAVISNNRSTSVTPRPEPVETCNPGDAAPVNGVCTGTTVTVTGTGTNTSTTTVAFTYPAIVE